MSVVGTSTRFAAGVLGQSTRLPWSNRLVRGYFSRTVNIIYYHSVASREYSRFGFFPREIDAGRLQSDLAWLSKHFRFATLQVAIEEAGELDLAGRPPIAVTFDDGFDLVADGVVELLEQFGVPATAFINTEMIGNDVMMWRHALAVSLHERGAEELGIRYRSIARERGLNANENVMRASLEWPYELREELVAELFNALELDPPSSFAQRYQPYFTRTNLQKWLERGHSAGSHTASHPLCDTVPPAAFEREFEGPAAWILENLGLDQVPFAYPFGRELAEPVARELVDSGTFSSISGVRGFAPSGTKPWKLQRYPGEQGLSAGLFGRSLLRRQFKVM